MRRAIHPDPVARVSQSEHAAAFLGIADGLLGRDRRRTVVARPHIKRNAAAA